MFVCIGRLYSVTDPKKQGIHQSYEWGQTTVEEHLFSSDINKTYTNRLRLKQRIKQFYGLKPSIIKPLLMGAVQQDRSNGI